MYALSRQRPGPSSVSAARMFCTADPASGSVIPMLISASPSATAGSQRSFMASGPRCSIPRGGPLKVSWQQMADDTSARAISSSTMEASTSPRPIPPQLLPHRDPQQVRRRQGLAHLGRYRALLVGLVGPGRHLALGHIAGELAQRGLVLALGQQVDPGPAPADCAHQPSSVPTMPTKLTHSPGRAAQVVGQAERPPGADGA